MLLRDKKTSHSATEPTGSPNRELKLLAAGVLLGMIPSLLVAWLAARYEYHHLIVERRVEAVKELGAAQQMLITDVRPSAEVILKKLLVIEKNKDPIKLKTLRELQTLSSECCRRRYSNFVRSLGIQQAILAALFGSDFVELKPTARCSDPIRRLEIRAADGDEKAKQIRAKPKAETDAQLVSSLIDTFRKRARRY